jgi:hypothetical protein
VALGSLLIVLGAGFTFAFAYGLIFFTSHTCGTAQCSSPLLALVISAMVLTSGVVVLVLGFTSGPSRLSRRQANTPVGPTRKER